MFIKFFEKCVNYTIHFFLKQNPVLTKILQIYASQNDSVKFLSNVSGDTFTKNEIDQMENEINKVFKKKFKIDINRDELEVIGCGTIGRVYRYDSVVFKVQIPGIIEKIKYNYLWLHKLFVIIDFLTRYHYHLVCRTETLMYSIDKQYDFIEEVKSSIQFQKDLENFNLSKYITTPIVLEDLCSESVICMEYINGIPLNKMKNLNDTIKNEYSKLFFANIFLFNKMHIDLHGGNVLIRNNNSQQIVIIDFGMMQKRVQTKYLIIFINVLQSFVERDIEKWIHNVSLGLYNDKKLTKNINLNKDKKNKFACHVLEMYHKNDHKEFGDIIKEMYKGLDNFLENEEIYGDKHLSACDTSLIHFIQFFSKHRLSSELLFKKCSKDVLEIIK